MISYLLLLNEHKETSDFGLGCPYHSYSIFIPHIPVGVFLLFGWFFLSPPIFLFSLPVAVKRPTALLTLHLVCTLRRKKKYFEYDAC